MALFLLLFIVSSHQKIKGYIMQSDEILSLTVHILKRGNLTLFTAYDTI